jgi:hypothetical protein
MECAPVGALWCGYMAVVGDRGASSSTHNHMGEP